MTIICAKVNRISSVDFAWLTAKHTSSTDTTQCLYEYVYIRVLVYKYAYDFRCSTEREVLLETQYKQFYSVKNLVWCGLCSEGTGVRIPNRDSLFFLSYCNELLYSRSPNTTEPLGTRRVGFKWASYLKCCHCIYKSIIYIFTNNYQ